MRFVHLSDLHFGAHDEVIAQALALDVREQNPDVVVVSGDFTQIGSEQEFRAAGAFLESLNLPIFAVPGNHDVPARNLWLRMIDPYRRYRTYISPDLEPTLTIGPAMFVGIKTSRRMRFGLNWSHGSISPAQLRAVNERLAAAPKGKVKIIVAHHPLLQPEQAMTKAMRLVSGAEEALDLFARLDVRLVLSGHFHRSYQRHHQAKVVQVQNAGGHEARPMLVLQAGSAISTRLRDDGNSYNIIDLLGEEMTIQVRQWRGPHWTS